MFLVRKTKILLAYTRKTKTTVMETPNQWKEDKPYFVHTHLHLSTYEAKFVCTHIPKDTYICIICSVYITMYVYVVFYFRDILDVFWPYVRWIQPTDLHSIYKGSMKKCLYKIF